MANNAPNKGDTLVATSTGGALGGNRYWAVRTEDIAGESPVDRANREGAAGTELTLYFHTGTYGGGTSPGTANTVVIEARRANGTLIKELHNGAVPASGTSFSLFLTNDGETGATPQGGGVEIYLRVIRDSGLNQYDVDSQNNAVVGTVSRWSRGTLRANTKVSDIVHGGYPEGSTYAYGAAADETITFTATHSAPYTANEGQLRADVLDVTTVQVAGVAVNVSGTSTDGAHVVDAEFDEAAKTYGVRFVPVGDAFLTPASGAELWTTLVDDGANVEQNGDNVRRQSFYDVDPRWTLAAPTLGESVYNRAESATHSFGITNARGEALTRTVSWDILDGNDDVVDSTSDTGPTYSNTRAIGGTERAANDAAGDQWSIITTQADAYNEAADIYAVSRKKLIKQTAAAAEGTVFTSKTASPSADDNVVFNRGDDVFFHAEIYNVRGELLPDESGFFAVRRTDQEAYELATQAITLNASGELTGAGATYAVPLLSVASPAGRSLVYSDVDVEQTRTGFGGQGNFAETDVGTPEWMITDHYELTAHANKKLPRKAEPETSYTSGEDSLLAWGNVVDANGDVVEGADVLLELIRPDDIVKASDTKTTIADGWTDPASAFDTSPPIGSGWKLRATVDNHNGNTGTADLALSMVSAFSGNKAKGVGFGPAYGVPNTVEGRKTAQAGDHAKPGDRLILGVGLVVDQVRLAPDADPPPQFMLTRFDQAQRELFVLQQDLSWVSKDDTGYADHYFDFKESIEDGLQWIASIGTAAQGVTAANGYVTDTGLWEPGGMFMAVRLHINTQPFDVIEPVSFAGPSAMHPMTAGDVFDLILEVDQGA